MIVKIHFAIARRFRFAGCLFSLALCLGQARAAETAAPESHAEFFDRTLGALMEREEIPGLAAVLVQGDRVAFQAGYGWADTGRKTPVLADQTIFPLGSISKVMTTVAVLQLVEHGTLDLDADIGRYLGPGRVDDRFPQPVTVRNLLTHTDGFDVRWLFGGAARVPEKVRPLPQVLAHLPPRIVPPGELYIYSDVGMTLAGYLVERASREPFAEYMERHVFQPLGMEHTTFRSTREFYARDRATGYDYDSDGRLRAVSITYPQAVPAAGATAPVTDIAALIRALLGSHATGRNPVLGEKWVKEMWREQFTQNPAVPGTSFGLYESYYRGHHALMHGGLSPGFTSFLLLLPDEGAGLFVAANRFDLTGVFEHDLMEETIDHLAPQRGHARAPGPPPRRAAAPTTRRGALDGLYRCDQYSRYSSDKLVVLAGLADEIEVKTRPDGRLLFQPAGTVWRPEGANVFRNERTDERVAFQTDARGRGLRIVGSAQFMSYSRVGWFARVGAQFAIVSVLLGLAAAGAAMALWMFFCGPIPFDRRDAVLSCLPRLLALMLALTAIGYIAALAFSAARLDFATAGFAEPRGLRELRYAPIIFGLMAVAQIALAVRAFRRGTRLRPELLAYALAGFAVLLLLPLLGYWNLLPPPFSASA